jgi:hypothetical protein
LITADTTNVGRAWVSAAAIISSGPANRDSRGGGDRVLRIEAATVIGVNEGKHDLSRRRDHEGGGHRQRPALAVLIGQSVTKPGVKRSKLVGEVESDAECARGPRADIADDVEPERIVLHG